MAAGFFHVLSFDVLSFHTLSL